MIFYQLNKRLKIMGERLTNRYADMNRVEVKNQTFALRKNGSAYS